MKSKTKTKEPEAPEISTELEKWFSNVGQQVLSVFPSFDMNDLVVMARRHDADLSYEIVTGWFYQWIQRQLRAGHIEQVPSVYDVPVWAVRQMPL
jgi:hypothetical protein